MRRKIGQLSSLRGNTGRLLRKHFAKLGDLEVVEAEAPLRLQPMPCDLKYAKPREPDRCVYVFCARRQHRATSIVFWKTSAYIDLVGLDGVRRIERFILTPAVRREIEKFDAGKKFNVGRAFILKAPVDHDTVASGRARTKARLATSRGRTIHRAAQTRWSLRAAEARLVKAKGDLADTANAHKPQSPKMETARVRVREAKVAVLTARERADDAWRKAKKLSKKISRTFTRHQAKGFDLSTRNGLHRYNFEVAA